MSIIAEYERNLQFEEQYISSVVEGLDETHIICPVCGVSVCLKTLIFSKRYHMCMIFFKLAVWLGIFKCVSHISHVWQEKFEHQQPFYHLPLRTVPEH